MKVLTQYVPILSFVAVSVLMLIWDAPMNILRDMLSGANVVSYIAYVLILTVAVVFMPLTVMPIIPIAASMLGPFAVALLSIIGWTLGASIAFLISRYLGRPILEKLIDLQKLDHLAQRIPEHTHFWFIVLLRLTLPVDVVSYALGLLKSLSFASYIGGTVVGVTWFSFAFAYMGNAFFEGNMIAFVEIALVSVCVFSIGWYLLHTNRGDK